MIQKLFGRDSGMRSTFLKYDPCVSGPDCSVDCAECMVSLISDRFLGQKFTETILSKKYKNTRNLFTYVLIADTIGCNLNCWFCYAWKYLKMEDAKKITHHPLSPEELAKQFDCKIRKTADLAFVRKRAGEKTAFSPTIRDKILEHINLELPFSRIRVSGGEPLFSNKEVLTSAAEPADPIKETMKYWLIFFEDLDKRVGQIRGEGLINIAPFDSEWQMLPYPVWLTEAKGRVMVRFDTNGLVFASEAYTDQFYSGLFELFKEEKLKNLHVQIDYSFKGATAKEFMWSQGKDLPATLENNDTTLALERNLQVRGLENISSKSKEFTKKDPDFTNVTSVTIEKGIEHDMHNKLWLYYPGALDWDRLAKALNIEFSDVVNYFDLSFGWRFKAKVQRYAKRGALIELTNGSEMVNTASSTIPEIWDFRRDNVSSNDFKILVFPTGERVSLAREKRTSEKGFGQISLTDQNYWIITGTEENLRVGLEHSLWGVQRSLEGLWNNLKKGDLVFFYCTRPVSGLVGYGRLIDTEIDEKPFWPNENPGEKSKYPLRMRFEKIEVFNDWTKEKRSLYGSGIEYFTGLNYVDPGKKNALARKMNIIGAK